MTPSNYWQDSFADLVELFVKLDGRQELTRGPHRTHERLSCWPCCAECSRTLRRQRDRYATASGLTQRSMTDEYT